MSIPLDLKQFIDTNVSLKNGNVDAKHDKIIERLLGLRGELPRLESEKQALVHQRSAIMAKPIQQCTIDELHSRKKIENEIQYIDRVVDIIQSRQFQKKYIMDVSDVLSQYYTKAEEQSSGQGCNFQFDDVSPENIDLGNSDVDPADESLDNFVISSSLSSKADILSKYVSRINKRSDRPKRSQLSSCPSCDRELIVNHTDGMVTCTECGYSEYRIIESTKPTFKDQIQETTYFCYKRINHFNETLNQIQAKESTDIPSEVIAAIKLELNKNRVVDLSKLSVSRMKGILKKLKLNKYYEHIPHIINKLNGLPPPELTPGMEDKLREMFKLIQDPFVKVCPKERKNFLSYNFVLHKMCQLLGLDQFLLCFPLLKSREKLSVQDTIWKGICKILSWEFIPSI